MKIAFIGQKGVPTIFGGIEQHVEELSTRLAARGHEVTVYVRNWYTPKDLTFYQGSSLIHTPTVKTKHLDAFIHSLSSSLHSLFQEYDIIHYHAIGPAFFSWLPKLFGKRVVVTIHRFDYDAAKWGQIARLFLKASEKVAIRVPHRTIVVAKHQYDFYLAQGYDLSFVKNGVSAPKFTQPEKIGSKFGLKGKDYILFLGRLVPEKRIDWLIASYLKSNLKGIKLVVAGNSSATNDYSAAIRSLAGNNANVIFTGNVTGQTKAELFSNARLFVNPSSIEGLPIAVLEAMSYGLPCLVSDIPAHREIVIHLKNGYLFDKNNQDELSQAIKRLMTLKEQELREMGISAQEFTARSFNWNDVTSQIENIYQDILLGKKAEKRNYHVPAG